MRGAGRVLEVRWGLAAGLALCVVLGVGSSAVAQQSEPSGPSPAISKDDPAFGQGAERERARAERLRGGQAREERRQSRERYRGLSRSEALGLAQRAFPEATRGRLPDGRRPAPDLRVVDQYGHGAALVQDAQGARFLLRSSLPLQVPAPGGGFAPLDLSLTEAADWFAPRASAAPIRIAKRLGGGVRFTEGGFALGPEGRDDAELIEADDRAFASEVAADTDFIAAPKPAGAEVSWVLRSPAAPEELVLDVELPAGASLRRARSANPIPNDPPEAIEIARGDEVLGYVYPPLAYDADGTRVPSRASIDGERIVIRVDHRGGDFRAPILVDPEVVQPNDNSTWGWAGWRFLNMSRNIKEGTSASNPGNNWFGAARNDPAYAPGLYESMPTHTSFDYSGAYAHWDYQPPANTYVYRTTFGSIRHANFVYGGVSFSRSFHGLMNSAYSAWESPANYVNQSGGSGPNPFGPAGHAFYDVTHDFCFVTRCDRTKGSEQNFALFGISAQNDVNTYRIYTGDGKATMTMGWANVYLGDRRAPYVTRAPSSSAWTNDNAAEHQAPVGAHDDGLGMKSFTLTGASGGAQTITHGCTGDIYRSSCPKDPGLTFTYRLAEGVNTLGFYARDIVDNQSATHAWTQRIDRSAPSEVALSGALYERAGRGVGQPLKLKVTARDTWSGVRKLQLLVNDRDVDGGMAGAQTLTQGDPGTGGSMSGELDFDPSGLAVGRYKVRVVATDGVGLTRS